jgi:hypothetical protein
MLPAARTLSANITLRLFYAAAYIFLASCCSACQAVFPSFALCALSASQDLSVHLLLFLCLCLCCVWTGYIPYSGDGFAVLLPSKWNPSQEQDFPGVVLRCDFEQVFIMFVVVHTEQQ